MNEAAEIAAKLESARQGDPGQFQTEIIRVKFIGKLYGDAVIPDPEDPTKTTTTPRVVIQETGIPIPKGSPRDQVALLMWKLLAATGGLSVKLKEDQYVLYPLNAFEKIDLEFSTVSGVTL
jgi:hypothetical protein